MEIYYFMVVNYTKIPFDCMQRYDNYGKETENVNYKIFINKFIVKKKSILNKNFIFNLVF